MAAVTFTVSVGSPEHADLEIRTAAFERAVKAAGARTKVKRRIRDGVLHMDVTVLPVSCTPIDWDAVRKAMAAELDTPAADKLMSRWVQEGVRSYWYGQWFEGFLAKQGYATEDIMPT